VLRHRVTVPTLCSLGEPEIAIGPEPRIEPWLPRNRIACQVSRAGGRCHYSKMNRGNGRAIQRRTSRAIESHQQIVGWISRQKISRLPAEGEPFLLTSPFIEPAISIRNWDAKRCGSELCVQLARGTPRPRRFRTAIMNAKNPNPISTRP
jgi:hypothetical protein